VAPLLQKVFVASNAYWLKFADTLSAFHEARALPRTRVGGAPRATPALTWRGRRS